MREGDPVHGKIGARENMGKKRALHPVQAG
jgi:hypothetical protein